MYGICKVINFENKPLFWPKTLKNWFIQQLFEKKNAPTIFYLCQKQAYEVLYDLVYNVLPKNLPFMILYNTVERR